MSQENVDAVASVYAAFARRDDAGAFEFYADDIEWDLSRGMTDGAGSVYRGHDGVRRSFRDLLASFASIDFTVEEITDVDDRVLVTVHERYFGRESGVEVDRRHYAVYHFREGKIVRMRVFLDRGEALEAAGPGD